ncbi:GIY-YIG nuclease family protein [Agrobacterium sp. S2/73]|uniref:GIY-YIG nuclease family protein n=1 Tax=unclassified Agrobacterium TaxID=2632611 RepID=UPI001ADB59FD|nr:MULTISPECIES: GIY-YIG nuclease family protein [unclassified Agrobacterium]MBO9108948.1 GIY-YIG nuclease family protein [Agrobacterium sp. S2/73]QXZ73302.1 GIY-YIG nuclease family protein [Agrobacterium sp. S7/73]
MSEIKAPFVVYAFAVDGDYPGLENAVKIGVAKNPSTRLLACQTGSPVRLYLKKTWPFEDRETALAFERACHAEFAEAKLIREWFSVTIEQIDGFRDEFYDQKDIGQEISELLKAVAAREKNASLRMSSDNKRPKEAKSASAKVLFPASKNDMLNTQSAAFYLQMSASWLNKTRLNGDGPAYHKVGGRVFYRVSDLDTWTDSNKRTAVYDFANRAK